MNFLDNLQSKTYSGIIIFDLHALPEDHLEEHFFKPMKIGTLGFSEFEAIENFFRSFKTSCKNFLV